MADAILALNAGSSSIKFSLFEIAVIDDLKLSAKGEVEKIDGAPHFFVEDANRIKLADQTWHERQPDFAALLETVIAWVETHLGDGRLVAVGHRVVHGGAKYQQPARVTTEVLAALEALAPLAPLHQPHNLAPVRVLLASRPNLPQVACFDTAFHRTMPAVATRFALPREYEAKGIQRYGFHGLSYEYIAGRLRAFAPDVARGRAIIAHLGNGASLCALNDGRSIDTTMGFSTLDGLVMGTRCGAIDPGVILYLQQQAGLSAKQIEDLLYHKSGLFGVSGFASDMRALLASADLRAREAIDLFVYRIVQDIGALANSLGGLDGIVFTAGIGEHAAEIRAEVCDKLGWLGVMLDHDANQRNDVKISGLDSRIDVLVIPTDEEVMIARHTLAAGQR